MSYNKINNILGWTVAAIATLTYILTAERTTSWWDTGEFISSAYKMQIVHQPGAPLFLMIQNIFGNLALGNVERIAFWMNIGSAISSGLTILFLFWTITALARKYVIPNQSDPEISNTEIIKIMGAGAVGALAYTFTDTFWYSAVESEVYAMSSLCTAVVFWAILKWEARADHPGADRWLILIAYMMGLSIGVHLLNLLVIPIIALVIYFRRTNKTTTKGVLTALGIGVIVLAIILWGIIQWLIKLAAYFDLFFVNSLGMGFGSGVIVFAIMVVAAIVYGIIYSIKKAKPLLNIIMLSLVFIIFGYSSFTMILIRAKANPTLNNSDPDNAFSFFSYLNREQYGDEPLIKGKYFDSRPTGDVEGKKVYRKDDNRYSVARVKTVSLYDRETLFPRLHSSQDHHVRAYREYLGLGPNESPTMADNLKYFFGYQIGHMYMRYFMWNFVGRQNDIQGHASLTDGNWISGIKILDNARLGGQYVLPSSEMENAAHNTYYFLPLILGLLGAYWHFKNKQRDASVVGLLFFFTGLAIVIYLNQTPLQPRERDYAYAGSFYAFCIWIGIGVLAIEDLLSRKLNVKMATYTATGISLLAAPILLASQNWDDHDRSQKFLARDMAKNYLKSCAPNAILFSYGDNDTYPLWYVQEVEGFRTDVRVVNLSLLGADWYMKQMMKKVNDAEALPINIEPDKIKDGIRDIIYYIDHQIPGYIEVQKLLDVMLSDNEKNMAQLQGGQFVNILPTQNIQLAIDRDAVISNKVVPEEWENEILDTMQWQYNKEYVSRAELSLLAILANNNWERPIYFTNTTPADQFMGLDRYLLSEGFTYRVVPMLLEENAQGNDIYQNTNAIYENIMNKYVWGNISHTPYLDPDSYKYLGMFAGSIFGETAQSLMLMGKDSKARDVVNKAYENLPKRIYQMSEVLNYIILIDAMYKTGEIPKANEIVQRNLRYIEEYLDYYLSIAENKPNLEYQNMRIGLVSLQRYEQVLTNVEETDLQQEVKRLLSKYSSLYGE